MPESEVTVETVTDPAFLEFAEMLNTQAERELQGASLEDAERIRATYDAKVKALLEWYENDVVRWTIA